MLLGIVFVVLHNLVEHVHELAEEVARHHPHIALEARGDIIDELFDDAIVNASLQLICIRVGVKPPKFERDLEQAAPIEGFQGELRLAEAREPSSLVKGDAVVEGFKPLHPSPVVKERRRTSEQPQKPWVVLGVVTDLPNAVE